jgi:hypothetical protein
MTSVEPAAVSGQLDFVGALLVADTRAFVSEWRQWDAARTSDSPRDSSPGDDPIMELRERSRTLQIRARAAGVGGLAHHLALAEECLLPECPRGRWEACLANVVEVAGQLEQEIELQRASSQRASSLESDASEGASEVRATLTGVAGPASEPALAAPVASPWRGWKRMPADVEPSLAEGVSRDVAEDGAAALSQVLGLTPTGASAAVREPELPSEPPPGGSTAESVAELLPAEFVVDAEEDDDELTDQDLEIRLDLSRRTSRLPLLLSQHEVAIELPPRGFRPFRRPRPPLPRSRWVAPVALGALASLAVLALVFTHSGARDTRSDSTTLTQSGALLPTQRGSGSEKGLYVLLAQAHTYGSSESPQLGQLMDDEAASLAKAMTEPCGPGSLGCALSEQGRLLLDAKPLDAKPIEGAVAGAAAAPAEWLAGLRLPQIGAPSDARIQKQLAAHTEDAVGHEQFQSLLFQCAVFQELFRGALSERGLPLDLAAVVMVESGCLPDPESPAGGRGLWRLTAARARAYHLRVQAEVIDERLNAAKATDAALELLSDLNAKLGSWQLALASYQLGAFPVLTRVRQASPHTDYAALASAGQLPADTLNYVAKVEAFALILANLEHFHFAPPPARVNSPSASLQVPAGTRLSLVARAVGSSAIRIRELNPELIAEVVPGTTGDEFSLRVPGDGGPSVRDQLDHLIAHADGADECVPLNFDWGRQPLTRALLTTLSHCKR